MEKSIALLCWVPIIDIQRGCEIGHVLVALAFLFPFHLAPDLQPRHLNFSTSIRMKATNVVINLQR